MMSTNGGHQGRVRKLHKLLTRLINCLEDSRLNSFCSYLTSPLMPPKIGNLKHSQSYGRATFEVSFIIDVYILYYQRKC